MPLSWILIGWFILVALFTVLMLITVIMFVRFGLSCLTTYVSTIVFLGVIVLTLLITGNALSTIDWNQTVGSMPSGALEPSRFDL